MRSSSSGFNPRLRAGGDRSAGESTCSSGAFQSTPPRGRRRESFAGRPFSKAFQSTPPRGRRHPARPSRSARPQSFNPRLRAGGDPICRRRRDAEYTFQSTPPRGRRPEDSAWITSMRAVSIHASAREATSTPSTPLESPAKFQSTPPRGRRRAVAGAGRGEVAVSIHASAREATLASGSDLTGRPGFNPRLRAGGDGDGRHDLFDRHVSIHASAREATGGGSGEVAKVTGFNPRLRAGGDPAAWPTSPDWTRFQSTPPRGRRPAPRPIIQPREGGFNPRLRAGGDRRSRRASSR